MCGRRGGGGEGWRSWLGGRAERERQCALRGEGWGGRVARDYIGHDSDMDLMAEAKGCTQ